MPPPNGRHAKPCCAAPSHPRSSPRSPDGDHLMQPGCDMVLDCAVYIFLADAGSFPNLKRVVAASDDIEIRRGIERGYDRAQLVRNTEGVARTLNEQHRRPDARQMLCAKPIGSARGMQRIAEKNQSRELSDARGSHL